MTIRREDLDLLRRVASRLIVGYDEQDLGLQVDELADRLSPEFGVCVPCKGTGLAFTGGSGVFRCEACGGEGERR